MGKLRKKENGKVKFETREYGIKGLQPLLGSNPADPEIRSKYIESKKPVDSQEDEGGFLNGVDEKSGLSVFLRDPVNGNLMMFDYVIRGFLKEALLTLSSQIGIVAAKSKVDKFLFAGPRCVAVLDGNGQPVMEPDGIFERSLRAMTMQGPRVALAGSEVVNDWQIKIKLTLIENEKTAKSKALTWEAVEQALSYGQFQGLGQFRNGGFGRFEYERLS